MAKKYIVLFILNFVNVNNIVVPGELSGIKDTILISKKENYDNDKNKYEKIIVLTFNNQIKFIRGGKIKIYPNIGNCYTINFEKNTIKITLKKDLNKTKINMKFNDAIIDCNNKVVENIDITI